MNDLINQVSMNRGLKDKLDRGEPVIGPFVKACNEAMVEVLGLSGMDYALFDLEHSPVSMEKLENLMRAADAVGLCSFVRVPELSEAAILHALDKGAGGLLIPMVNNREMAQKAVQCAKYAPLGKRGMDIYSRQSRFGAIPKTEYMARANAETLIAVQIEGQEGLDNLDGTLEVDGIDIIYIGPYDLSQSLGIPGQVRDERILTKAEEITLRARAKGRRVGIYVDDVEMAERYAALGVQLITLGVDIRLFAEKCAQMSGEFRALTQGVAAK